MTRVEIPVLTPAVHIDDQGKITVACDTHSATAVLTPDHYRGADVRLVRAMYLASCEWLILNREIDAPTETPDLDDLDEATERKVS